METTILLVDDEVDILEFLSYNLRKEGFTVVTAENGRDAMRMAVEHQPALIVLDVLMPHINGIEVCKQLREMPSFQQTTIAFLTATQGDVAQIEGLDAGADDFIEKPIKPQVFISRVKALLRRNQNNSVVVASPDADHIIKIADLEINKVQFTVHQNGIAIELPKKEFEILCLLVSKPGRVFLRHEIYQKIWGDDIIVGDRTLDVYIRKLREKIGLDCIKTLKGIGYKFNQ
jgi:two-component system alkaline phosphatase synthesis response regulator PhoP